jgi:hypothetical protein
MATHVTRVQKTQMMQSRSSLSDTRAVEENQRKLVDNVAVSVNARAIAHVAIAKNADVPCTGTTH